MRAEDQEAVVRLLADLVRIPSVNPMGRAVQGPAFTEAAVADHLATYLRAQGIDVHVDEVSPGRPNVTGFIDAGAPRTLMLEAHMDTVHTGGMRVEPFGAEIRDGLLFGRGACDTKGSLAAFFHAATRAARKPRTLRWNVLLVATADEEYQFTGAQHAMRAGIRADAGIAGEPTSLRIIRAHKGVVRWHLRTRGKAAHAAYPERGENAIYRMGAVLTRLEQYARSLMGRPPHALLGTPTLSVGVIEGGQAVNIVPDECRIEIDRRMLPGEEPESAVADVAVALQDLPGWEMAPPHLAAGGMDVSPDAPVVRTLAGAIQDITGGAVVEGAHYATDAGVFNAGGIPTVVFGPGDIALAHTAEEHIPLEDVFHACAIIERLLTDGGS